MAWWYGTTSDKVSDAELRCFARFSLPFRRVSVQLPNQMGAIRTVGVGDAAVSLLGAFERRTRDGDEESLPASDSDVETLVLTHGFGGGFGMYFQNLEHLVNNGSAKPLRVLALDWMGMGNSSRTPKFPSSALEEGQANDEPGAVTAAELFFIESLESWRKELGLDHFVLLGHSLGGYLSTHYALRYPQHVDKLILVSPAAIPAPPPDLEEKRRQRSVVFKAVLGLWDSVTVQSVARALGPAGPRLTKRFSEHRFARLGEEDRHIISDYIYQISVLPASGELAQSAIFAPGAWARRPLAPRLAELQMSVTFLYGEHDWMDVSAAEKEVQRAPVGNLLSQARVLRIPGAGHQVFLDNAEAFNTAVLEVCH